MNAVESADNFKQPRLWLSAILCSLLLAVEIWALVHDLEPTNGVGHFSVSRPIIATLKKGLNDVRNKSAGTIAWSVTPQGENLRRLDSVLTMNNSQAFLEFTDGAEMTIEPDSLVVLEKTPAEDSARYQKIVVKLVEGSIAKKTAGGLPMSIDVGGTSIEDAAGDSLFHLRAEKNGQVRLEVERGSIQVNDGTNTKTIGAAEQAEFGKGAIEVRKQAELFTELSPDNARQITREEPRAKVLLTWRQSTRQAERVRVSRKADFSNSEEEPIQDAHIEEELSNRAVFDPHEDGLYYWRVEGKKAEEAPSKTASFSVITKIAPEAEDPGNDDEVSAGKAVAFRWKATRAPNVVVELSPSEDFTTPSTLRAPASDLQIQTQFEKPQILYWRVRGDYGETIGLSKPSEKRKLVITERLKLKAPKLRKARVRIETSAVKPRAWAIDEPSGIGKVIVDLEWDAVKGAAKYRLQIALDETFKHVLSEKTVNSAHYGFRTTQSTRTQRIYYRVSSVDSAGNAGPFSDPEEIEIEGVPLPKPQPSPTPTPTPKAPPTARGDDGDKPPTAEELARRGSWRLDVYAGVAFHSRKFKSEKNPIEAVGAGIIPFYGGLEIRKLLGEPAPDNTLRLDFGFNLLAEQATPKNPNVISEKYKLPMARGWLMLENSTFLSLEGGVGAYVTTTNQFKWVGRAAVATRVMPMGVSLSLANSQTNPQRFHWRLIVGAVAVGARGADVDLIARYPIFGPPRRGLDLRGFFVEGEGLLRYFNIETSFGGALRFGYAF